MTTKNLVRKDDLRPLELGTAIAVGAALTAAVSPAVGVGVGVALMMAALREKKKVTLHEGIRLAVCAVVVGLVVTAGVLIIENWSDFKEGVIQGYQKR